MEVMMHDKAIVINKFWMGIISMLIGAILIGGFTYAWNANAQIAVLQHDVNDLKSANIDQRLTRIEEQQKAVVEKLDILIRRGR